MTASALDPRRRRRRERAPVGLSLAAIAVLLFLHLPMAVVVAHEVGHAVEHDFWLEAALTAAFAALAVPDERKVAWSAWREELFADAYGVLCCGPAYVQALMDFLLGAPAAIQRRPSMSASGLA